MTKVPFLLLLITFSGYSSLAKNDSLSHIKFKTDFERHVFEHLDSVEPLDLLLAISENMSFDKSALIKNKIVAFIESNDKIAQGKETKMVKKIFAKTHSSFFSKYEEVSNFENIFELKEYNCVSATALYSLIFDAYGIPYQVKEAPSHVYTVAYPGTHDILVESTAPTSGYYYATEGDIHNSIQNLISLKYVTQDEVDSMGERAVYDAFFFKVEDINLRELAGLQYHNEAISYADKEDYEAALNAALKCQMIYPSERIDILILGILDMTLTNRRIDTWSEVKNLMVYGTQDNVQPLTFSQLYNVSIRNTLFVANNVARLDSIKDYLLHWIDDSATCEVIDKNYYYSLTEYHYNSKRFSKALKYADTSYHIDTTNFYVQQVITECLIHKLTSDYSFLIEHQDLGYFEKIYPFLCQNSLFQSMRLSVHAGAAYDLFRDGQLAFGLARLDSIEKIYTTFGEDLIMVPEVVVDAYGKGAMLEYKRRNYLEADAIIKRGLVLYPYSTALYERLNLINVALNRPYQEVPNKHKMLMQREEEAYKAFLKARNNK